MSIIPDFYTTTTLPDPTTRTGEIVFLTDTNTLCYSNGTDWVALANGDVIVIPSVDDTTPDSFSFTPVTNATLTTDYTATITVSGIDAPAAISIAGGSYKINTGSYTTTAGTVANGDSVTVKLASSGSFGTSTSATLTIGGVSGSFQVTTAVPVGVPALVWDTDSETDCDDLLSLAHCISAHRAGQIELVAVMVSSCYPTSVPTVRIMLDAYGLPNVPVGYSPRNNTRPKYGDAYPTAVRDRFGIPGETETSGRFPQARALYRQLLVDHDLLYVAVGGFLRCLYDLLTSPADSISPLTGSALVASKDVRVFLTGGRPPGIVDSENNFGLDPVAANYVLANWPLNLIVYNFPYDITPTIPKVKIKATNDPAIDPMKFAWNESAKPVTGDAGTLTLLDANGERFAGDNALILEILDEIAGIEGTHFSRSALGTQYCNTTNGSGSFTYSSTGKHRFLTPVSSLSTLETIYQTMLDNLQGPTSVNLWKQSNSLAAGVVSNSAVKTDNSTIAPDGTQTADTIAGSGWAGWRTNFPAYGNHAYTFSVAIKKTSGRSRFPALAIQFLNGSTVISEAGGVINTNTGIGYAAPSAAAPAYGSVSATVSVSAYPTGPNAADYWLATVTVTTPSSATNMNVYIQAVSGNSATAGTRDASGSNGNVIVWGMQLEPTSAYTQPLPTDGDVTFLPAV